MLIFLALWGVLLVLHLQALQLWTPLQPLSRIADVLCLPFAVPAGWLFPPVAHHHSVAHYVLRTGLAAGAMLLALRLLPVIRGPGKALPGPTRREVLLGSVAAAAGAAGVWATCVEPGMLRLRRYEVSLPGLPPELDGFRLAHATDTHYGPYIGADHIRRAFDLLNAEEPDLLVLTGDYVHRTPLAVPTGIQLLTHGKARLGSVAVLGNHDHWEGAEACRTELRRHGIPLLENRCLFLSASGLAAGPSPHALAVCGVGDLWEGVVDPQAALAGVPEGMPRLLLSHNPDVAEEIRGVRFDLQLSGHTHGGQVSLPMIGTPLVPSLYGSKYAGGLVQGPGWPVIVSRGVGMAVTPVRLNVPPEVSLIILRRIHTTATIPPHRDR